MRKSKEIESMNQTEKPPYKIPSMKEIADTPWNGYNVVSLFAGAGGSSLGYRMSGFRVLFASEFVPEAFACYQVNKADYTYLDNRDIRDVTPTDILSAINLKEGQLDIFCGSPPCASFSTNGAREKKWNQIKDYSSGISQRCDDLFFEFSRILSGLQPRVFVAENVRGLALGTAKGYFIQILEELENAGYVVSCRLVNALWTGVPQDRQRLIFIGVRKDLAQAHNIEPSHPLPLQYHYSISDALEGLQEDPKDAHYYPPGTWAYRAWQIVPPGLRVADTNDPNLIHKPGSGHSHTKADPGRYCRTIVANCAQSKTAIMHWSEPRSLSIGEIKRISSFPDDFQLPNRLFKERWERIGRAVPPVMMHRISSHIRDNILGRIDHAN